MSRFRFVFIVLQVTAILILTVYLRSSKSRTFYRLSLVRSEKSRLKRSLNNKQLKLEHITNPAALWRQFTKSSDIPVEH